MKCQRAVHHYRGKEFPSHGKALRWTSVVCECVLQIPGNPSWLRRVGCAVSACHRNFRELAIAEKGLNDLLRMERMQNTSKCSTEPREAERGRRKWQ